MENSGILSLHSLKTRTLFVDTMALLTIAFTPALSHLLQFPVYFIEPMRIMLVLSLVYTRRNNAYFLAIAMPLLSYLVSGHPLGPKMFLIMLELSLNVWFFMILSSREVKPFFALFAGILLSKLVYYVLKFGFISLAWLDGSLFSTPIWVQALLSLFLSTCLIFAYHPAKK